MYLDNVNGKPQTNTLSMVLTHVITVIHPSPATHFPISPPHSQTVKYLEIVISIIFVCLLLQRSVVVNKNNLGPLMAIFRTEAPGCGTHAVNLSVRFLPGIVRLKPRWPCMPRSVSYSAFVHLSGIFPCQDMIDHSDYKVFHNTEARNRRFSWQTRCPY